MANYPQELAQDAVCQSHTGHMTGLWFLPTQPLRLNTNEWIYVIRRVQVKQDGLKLNGTHQLVAYADDVNILGGSVHTVKGNAEAVVVTSKDDGPEVNADRTNYMVKYLVTSGVWRVGGFGVFKPPPTEIPKALQNRAKLNPTVKTVKNCWI